MAITADKTPEVSECVRAPRADTLSTYGLLKAYRKATVREWIEQLCGQDVLKREEEHRTLALSETGRQVLRGELTPRLLPPRPARATPLRKGLETLPVEETALARRLNRIQEQLDRIERCMERLDAGAKRRVPPRRARVVTGGGRANDAGHAPSMDDAQR